jgi:hypothetical protein
MIKYQKGGMVSSFLDGNFVRFVTEFFDATRFDIWMDLVYGLTLYY